MAARFAIVASLLCAALLLSEVNLSECTDAVRGKVSCLDCKDKIFNLSGIIVAVKCDKTEKLWTAMTEDDGSFEVAAEIPTSSQPCLAEILGGPHQMYASRKTMVSRVVKERQEKEGSGYTTSTPLGIYSSCPEKSCSSEAALGASKTINLPLPKEWGLAPSSFYFFPLVPIIGIPH